MSEEEHFTRLPALYDSAVVGIAERHTQTAHVYDYRRLVDAESGSQTDRLSKVAHTLLQYPDTAVLHTSLNRDAFWKEVKSGKKIVWEQMHHAILGVMSKGLEASHAVVYDRAKVLDFLADSVEDSDEAGVNPWTVALRDYSDKIKTCYAGPATPWYLVWK